MITPEQSDYYKATHLDREHISHGHLVVAGKIMDTMVDTFVVGPDSVRTIPHEEDGQTNAAVIYVGDGLDMGSWSAITDPDNAYDFMLDIGNGSKSLKVDTRRDIEFPLFQSMVKILQAEARCEDKAYLPSLVSRANGNALPRVRTWLTGYADYEDAEDDIALVGVVPNDGEPTMQPAETHPTKLDALTIGFRPAVIVSNTLVGQYAQIDPVAFGP